MSERPSVPIPLYGLGSSPFLFGLRTQESAHPREHSTECPEETRMDPRAITNITGERLIPAGIRTADSLDPNMVTEVGLKCQRLLKRLRVSGTHQPPLRESLALPQLKPDQASGLARRTMTKAYGVGRSSQELGTHTVCWTLVPYNGCNKLTRLMLPCVTAPPGSTESTCIRPTHRDVSVGASLIPRYRNASPSLPSLHRKRTKS